MTTFDLAASLEATERQYALGAIKVWEDLVRYEHAIAATQPTMIVETGTNQGGSAEWFARFAKVVTVDIVPRAMTHPRITQIAGSSTDEAVLSWVRELTKGERVMVSLDSDHHADHVRAEITTYAPLVSPGCYLVVEDGIVRWMDGENYPGPLDAIEEMLVDNPDWVRDQQLEDMFPVTMYPAGWWLRA